MAHWELRWRPAAEADLQRNALFIAEDNVEAAVGLIDVAEAEVELLAAHPFACEEVPVSRPELRGIRRLILPAPYQLYLVFYRALEEQRLIDVVRVLHGARDLPRSIWEPAPEEP